MSSLVGKDIELDAVSCHLLFCCLLFDHLLFDRMLLGHMPSVRTLPYSRRLCMLVVPLWRNSLNKPFQCSDEPNAPQRRRTAARVEQGDMFKFYACSRSLISAQFW